jgi:hypothetical protein
VERVARVNGRKSRLKFAAIKFDSIPLDVEATILYSRCLARGREQTGDRPNHHVLISKESNARKRGFKREVGFNHAAHFL